jgi:DNA-binding response OmpR family regulator
MDRLLIVDDDLELCELVREYLNSEGFEVEAAHDGKQGVERFLSGRYSLMVLDVMLPGINGFEVLRRTRAKSAAPVLMLTARGNDVDRIVGLEIGADDYLPKPFNPRELVARIRAILRRTGSQSEETSARTARKLLFVGDIELDHGAHVVRCSGVVVELTSVEFTLLEVLLGSAGQVVTREELAKTGLGRNLALFDRSVDMHISHLRKKLGPGLHGSERIKTIRGAGYVYAQPPNPASE